MAKSAGGKNTGRSEIISELKELRSLIADVSGMKADVQVDTGDIEKANDELSKFNEKIFEAQKTLKSFKSTGQIHYFATQEKALAHLTRAWEEYKKASSEDDKKTASGKLMRWANAYRGAGYSTDSVEKEIFETADRIYESYKTTGKKGESNSQKLWAKDVFEKVFGAAREVGVDVTESDKYWERRARNIRETAKKVTQESVEQAKSEPVELDVSELLKIDESGLDARAKKIMKSLRKTRDKLIDENNEPTDKSLGKNQGPQFLTDYEEFLKYKENSGNKYRIRGIKKTRDIVLQEMGLKDTDEDLAPFKLQAQQNLNKALEKANRAVRRARQKSGAAPAEGSSTEGGNPQTQGSMTQAGEDARDAGQAAKDAAQSFEEAGDKAQKAGKKAAASAEETREAAEETKKAAKEASEAQDEASVGRGGNKPAEDARETAAALNEERDAARGVNEERERIAAASGSGDNTASRARENAAALDEEKKAQQEVNDERSKMDKTSGQNEEPLSYLDAMILKLEEEKEKLKELQDESDKTRKMLDAASDVKELKKAREIIHGVVKNNQTGETKRNAFGFEGNPTALGSLVRQKLSEGNIGRAAAYYGEYAQAGGTDKFFDLTGKDITAELAERYKQAAEAIGKNPDELRKALNEVNKKILTQREVVSQIEKEVKAAQKEAAAQRKEQAQQEQETNTDWQNGLNEQEIEAVEAYLKKMKALKKEAYNESTALAQAMSLLEKIKKRDISGLMDKFTAPNQASNAMLGKMTNMSVNNQKARNAALRSLNQEEYDRLIQEQTQAVNDALDNKKSDFQQKWAEVADAMLGGDAFADAKPMVKGQILKELEKYADTAKDAIDEINKQWLSGTLDESKFSGKYAKQYIQMLNDARDDAQIKREAKVGELNPDSLFSSGGTTALTQEQVDALHAEAAAYDDLIAKKKEYYGIKDNKSFGRQTAEYMREIDDWIDANTNKQMFPPVVNMVDTVEEIETAITKIEEFRDKLKAIQDNPQFSTLSPNMQSDIQRSIGWLETLIETEKRILGMKKEFDRQNNEPAETSEQENNSQIKLRGTLEEVEQAYKDLTAAKETYDKAKTTKESFSGITDQSALIRERRRRSYDAYDSAVARYQEAFDKYNGFFGSKQDAEEWGKQYDAAHVKEAVAQEEDSVAKSQAAIRAEIDETNEIIKEQGAWFDRVKQVNDELTFTHKNKRQALKELKQTSAEYKVLKENPDNFDEIETARRIFRYQNAGTHAEQLGLDPEVISQYWTKLPLDQFKEETRKFAEESARRNAILYEAKERLQELTIEYNKAEVAALSSELGTTIRKEQNKINREIKAYENGVLETQSHENQKLILEKYDNAPRKSSAEFLDFQSTEEYSKLDERGKSLVDGLIQAYQKLEMIKKDGGLEYLQMLKQEKELTEEIGDVREKLFNAQDSERNGDKVDATSLLSEKETIDSIIEKLKLLDSEKAKTYGIFGTSKHEAGTGDIQKQIDSLIQAKNDIDAILERVGQSAPSSSNASTFAADIKSLEGYSSANEDFVNQLIADVIAGQKEYDQAMNELKTHIAQRQEEIRAEEELRAKRVRNAGFGEDVKALENYGYADKDFIQKLTAQVLEGTKEYDDAMDELKAHIEQKHAEMMAAAEKSERDNAEIARYDELAKPMLEQMGFTDSRPEGFYRFVEAIREEGIDAEEALRRFADTVGYVYDEVAGKWQKITEPKGTGHGARYLDEVPEGWKKIEGALTAPKGYEWYSNGKSRFSGEYQQALVKIKEAVDDVTESEQRMGALDKKVAELQYLHDKVRTIFDGKDGIINEDMTYDEKFNSAEVQRMIELLSQLSDAELKAAGVMPDDEGSYDSFRQQLQERITLIKEAQDEIQKVIDGQSNEDRNELDLNIARQLEEIYGMAEEVGAKFESRLTPAVREFLSLIEGHVGSDEMSNFLGQQNIDRYVDDIISGTKTAKEAFADLENSFGWDTERFESLIDGEVPQELKGLYDQLFSDVENRIKSAEQAADEFNAKLKEISEQSRSDQSPISQGVDNPKFDFSSKSFDELVNISNIKKGSDELNAALRESMEHLVEMYNAGNTESEEYYGTLYRIINLQKQMWKFNGGNGSGHDALAQSTKDAFSEQTKEKMRLQDSILGDLKKYSGIDLGVIDSAIQIITDLKNDVGKPVFQPFIDGKPMSVDKFKKYYLDMLREGSNETPVSQGDTTSPGLDSSISDTIQDNNNKAIASTEELISTVKELEEIYSKFQRPKYEKQESSYIDQLYNVEGIDLSGYNSVSTSEDNINQTRQKMMEIYSLYKKVTSAIKNNAGYYKGVQYTDADQENLIKDFKAYAQNYHELVTEYNDREGRISKDIGIDPEYLETLDVVVQKLTKDFRGYAQEVITDSQSVSDNNRLYEEEQVQLEQSNAALRERYNLLRNQVLDYAKSKGIDDNQLDTIREMIPFIRESGFQDWGDLFDWGDTSSLEHPDTVVNVLQEILRILGIEIPEAAGKAKKAISEVGEGSVQQSQQESPEPESSKRKYRVSATTPHAVKTTYVKRTTTPPSTEPETTSDSAAAAAAAAAAAEKEKAAKEGAAAAAEEKAAAEKNDSEATRENAVENQANTDAEGLGEDISGVGGRAVEAAGELDLFTESAKNAAEAARKAAGIEGEARIISKSGVNGTNASATYELARGMHYTENWSYRNGNEETGEEPGWAMTSARYVINYQALLNDTVTTLKALRKAEADLALAQEQGRGENVTSQIQAQIDLYQKRIDQNATLAEQYEKMRDLEIEDFELRDGYTKRQYDEDLKAQEELINAQSGAKKAKSVDDERKRQAAKQDKEVARAQKYATERLVALKQLESSFTTEGSSRYLSVEDDRTAITGMAGKLRTKLEDIIKQNKAMTIDEMDDIITQFGDIKVEGDTRYSRSTAKKGDLSRQKVDSLKNVLSSDLDAFSQQAQRSSGDISHITEEVNKLKEALNGNVSSEFITESFQKLRELRAELKAINEEQRTKTSTEKARQAEIKLVAELQESYIKLAEAEEKRDHASTEAGRELGRRQSEQINKRQEELKKRVGSTFGEDFVNKAVSKAEAEANKLRTAYANDRNEGISTKGLGFGENDDVERTWDTLIAKAQQYQKILYKQQSGGTITVNEAALLQKLSDLYQQAGEKAEEAGEKGQKFNEAVAAAQQAVRDSVISKYSETIGGLTAGNKNMPEAYNKQVEELKNNLEQLKNIDFDTTEWKEMVGNLDAGLNNLRTDASMRPVTDSQKAQLDRQMASWMNSNSGAGEFLGQVQRLRDALSNVRAEDEFNGIQSDFEKVRAAAADAGKTGESFGEGLKKRFKSLGQYLLSFASFYRVIDVFKQAFNTVKQLDDALTEMRKVSDESLSSLQRYQSLSFNIADEVGTTAQQIQQSTADWLRLGESFEEAQKSAKESTILLNVSEFDNIDKATEALVSASQAYKDLDKIDIIDKLNNIGNNFSISTDQLATGLQNSAAVLMTQGNDIDEALALLTAGNAITQDISKTSAGITYARTYSNIRVLKTRKQLYRLKTRDGSDRAKTLRMHKASVA